MALDPQAATIVAATADSSRDPAAIEWLWRQYLEERDDSDPLASPLSAPSLHDLPPAVIVTAEYDVLRDEGDAYAERLAQAGVPVDVHRYAGMTAVVSASKLPACIVRRWRPA